MVPKGPGVPKRRMKLGRGHCSWLPWQVSPFERPGRARCGAVSTPDAGPGEVPKGSAVPLALPSHSAPPLSACLRLWNKLPGSGQGATARLHCEHGNGTHVKPKPSSRAPASPFGARPAPRARGVPRQPAARRGGGSGESQRGFCTLPAPCQHHARAYLHLKRKARRKTVGGAGHAFPPWRLGHTPANQGADAPPCGCGVEGGRGYGGAAQSLGKGSQCRR